MGKIVFFALQENEDGTTKQTGGVTSYDKDITMNTDTDTKMNQIHEIGHTLGLDHPKKEGTKDGLMAYPPRKMNQNEANQLGNGSFLPEVKAKEE